MLVHNPNCDGGVCTSESGDVRRLPMSGDAAAILCHACYKHEMRYRRERNQELDANVQYDLPDWHELPIYTEGVAASLSGAYSNAIANWKDDGAASEITANAYYEALGVLPPIYGEKTETKFNRFWISEMYTSDRQGRELSLECWQDRQTKRFYCRLTPVER